MNARTSKTPQKRGQRKNTLDIPQRLLDRLTPSVLETPRSALQEAEKPPHEPLTLDKLFNRYYAARQAAGAAERTLEDYRKHMNWFRRFLASEYSGLDNFVPNRDVIRSWISHMLAVQKLKPSTINIRLRTVKAMFNWAMSESPFNNVELLRVPEEDLQVISKAQERKLFSCCELTTFTGLRDALLMSFLLDTGVRIGECMRILAEEIDLQNRSASVRAESVRTVVCGGG